MKELRTQKKTNCPVFPSLMSHVYRHCKTFGGKKIKSVQVLNCVIRSTVNNLQGASLVKSLLWGRQWREVLWAAVSLAPGFCLHFHYISSTLSDASIPFPISRLGFNLLTLTARLTSPSCATQGNRRGLILQHMNQGKMKCTPDAFRWF